MEKTETEKNILIVSTNEIKERKGEKYCERQCPDCPIDNE